MIKDLSSGKDRKALDSSWNGQEGPCQTQKIYSLFNTKLARYGGRFHLDFR